MFAATNPLAPGAIPIWLPAPSCRSLCHVWLPWKSRRKKWRIVAAGVADAVVDGVVPVEIVIAFCPSSRDNEA